MPNTDTPNDVTTNRQSLSGPEQKSLQLSFERALEDSRTLDTETVREKFEEYREEISVGAEIARAQFDQQFGGVNPSEGKFALSRIESGYFGWDSWENLGSLTGQSLNNWLDDDTPDNLSGGTGLANPLKVGEEAVHVILGVGTYHDSPKVKAIEYEVNESPRTAIRTKYEFTETDLQIKWLDRAIILPQNSLLAARLYAGQSGDDYPYLVGTSFIKYRASQEADPTNMTDDSQSISDNIVAQG